jgi:2-aminoadipate transaminase
MTGPISFWGGLPDARLWPDLAADYAAVLAEEPDVSRYGRVQGDAELRSLVAERLARRAGCPVADDQVILTNGCAGALDLLARTVVEPGTVVAVEELTYPGGRVMLRDHGARLVTIPVDADGMDVAALERILQAERVSVVYTVASCHNPTGTTMSAERRARLAGLAATHGFLLVQDDTYGEITFAGAEPPLLLGLQPEHVVHLGSFSKTMAPGLRLGYLAAPPALAARVLQHRHDLGGTPLVQRVVTRYLADGRFDTHLAEIRSAYQAKRDTLVAALARDCAGLGTWQLPSGGFFLWFELNDGDVDLVAQSGEAQGVRFLGGPYFSAGPRNGRGLRLAYGEIPQEQLGEGVRRLARAIETAAETAGDVAAPAPGAR